VINISNEHFLSVNGDGFVVVGWVSLCSTQPTFYLVYEIYFVDGFMVVGWVSLCSTQPFYNILPGICVGKTQP